MLEWAEAEWEVDWPFESDLGALAEVLLSGDGEEEGAGEDAEVDGLSELLGGGCEEGSAEEEGGGSLLAVGLSECDSEVEGFGVADSDGESWLLVGGSFEPELWGSSEDAGGAAEALDASCVPDEPDASEGAAGARGARWAGRRRGAGRRWYWLSGTQRASGMLAGEQQKMVGEKAAVETEIVVVVVVVVADEKGDGGGDRREPRARC